MQKNMSEIQDTTTQVKEGQNPSTQESQTTTEPKTTVQERNFEALRQKAEKLEKELEKSRKVREEEEKKKLEADGKLQELLDKERKEKEDLKSQYQNQARQSLLEKELARAGINNELVDMILPSVLNQVEFDGEKPTNLESLLENLKTTKPSLFNESKPQPIPAGKVGAGVTNSSSNVMTPEQALEMINRNDYFELQKYDKEIRQALSS
jgi:hypothetical protein